MRSVVLLLLLAQTVPAPSSQPAPASAPQAAPAPAQPTAAYVPERVYDTRRHAFGDFEQMIAELAGADVVLVGEQHDDPNTHRLEQALLDGLRRRKVAVTVSLEMFERDVQDVLDGYLASAISETDFLKAARPWPRYASAYRPLVELAKAQGWPVVAANVPRRHAADVAKSGKSALDKLSDADRALAARELECPQDGYFDRFVAAMGNHGSKPLSTSADGDEQKRQTAATNERYYWSQCVKDETMAESIARAVERRSGSPGPVVHFNGAFHSDFGAGTAERTRRRLAGRRVAVVTMLPVADVDTLAPAGDDLKRADFLVYTIK
jgi:uncharacterized iron-regulated protein